MVLPHADEGNPLPGLSLGKRLIRRVRRCLGRRLVLIVVIERKADAHGIGLRPGRAFIGAAIQVVLPGLGAVRHHGEHVPDLRLVLDRLEVVHEAALRGLDLIGHLGRLDRQDEIILRDGGSMLQRKGHHRDLPLAHAHLGHTNLRDHVCNRSVREKESAAPPPTGRRRRGRLFTRAPISRREPHRPCWECRNPRGPRCTGSAPWAQPPALPVP